MFKVKHFVVMLLCIVLLVAISSTTFAAPKEGKKGSDVSLEARKQFIEDGIIRLGAKEPHVLEQWLGLNGIIAAEIGSPSADSIGIMSGPGDAYIYDMGAYYDTWAKKYLIKGAWKWNSINLVDTNAGAVDTVSLSMHKTDYTATTGQIWRSQPHGMALYDQWGNYHGSGTPGGTSASALLMSFQDRWTAHYAYVGYQGSIWGWLDQKPSQSPIYLAMNFEHTWTDAQLQSLTFKFGNNSAGLEAKFDRVLSRWVPPLHNQITVYNWPNH